MNAKGGWFWGKHPTPSDLIRMTAPKVVEIFEKYRTPIDMVTTSEIAVSVTIDDPKYLEKYLQNSLIVVMPMNTLSVRVWSNLSHHLI
mgnify:CR=1 FL=1